jgi:hypothetical protein
MDRHESDYYPVVGEPAEAGSLRLPKAVELVQLLRQPALPHVRLVGCQQFDNYELVVVDVEAEVPQYPVHDVRSVERVAIGFGPADTEHQTILALRRDFPLVPHLHFGAEGVARALCLYQVAYDDLKPTWTAAGLLRQLQLWLTQTARGELHAPDQTLEQAFYAPPRRLVLPAAFFSADASAIPEPLAVRFISKVLGQTILVASTTAESGTGQFASCVYTAPPQVHGLIHEQPHTIAALQGYLSATDTQFTDTLRQHLRALKDRVDFDAERRLLLILRLPKQRTVDGPVEKTDVWAFASTSTLAEIGTDLGIWAVHEQTLAQLLTLDPDATGRHCPLELLNVVRALNQRAAAAYNGLRSSSTRYVAIGAGSLGSQVVNNLVRAGQGCWVWLDEDQYLPHNAARHYLPGNLVGVGKAQAMASLLRSTYEGADVQAIAANVLRPAEAQLTAAYEVAEVVLDMSASVAVARHLARGIKSSARRLSLFLNPSGTDLVLLAEPQDRAWQLDHMEMDYYRALLRQPELQGHLLQQGQPIRYAHACRDVSVQLPQDQVALHAAIGARAVRMAVAEPGARLKIWRSQPDLTTTAYDVQASPYTEITAGNWTVVVSHQLLQEISDCRQVRLPNETGGILVGVFDTQQHRVYIVDHIRSPPDSQESPTGYVRGVEGVPEELARISDCTGRQVGYVGEWHSHPDRYPTDPSEDDKVLFSRLQYESKEKGLPAIMAISGAVGVTGWYVGDVTNGRGAHQLAR